MKALLLALGVTGAFVAAAFVAEQLRLRKHRGVPREDFIRIFTDSGIPSAISATVYDYYKSSAFSKSFSIGPDDSYEYTLNKGEEDIQDDASFLAKKLGLAMPPDETLDQLGRRIKTLRDMTTWLGSIGAERG